MRRNIITLVTALFIGSLTLLGVQVSGATPDPDLHCEGHNVAPNVKDQSGADDNDLVPAAGTIICVKAGTGNTGIIVADGETTLQEHLFQAGIVDGSGTKGRDVSYWVLYPPVTTTTEDDSTTTTSEQETTTTTEPETTTTVPDDTPDGGGLVTRGNPSFAG